MDPISIIVAAVVAGAAAALKDTAGQAVKDAYRGFVGLLKRRIREHTDAEAAVDKAEQDSETARIELERVLQAAGVTADDEVVRAAQQVLALADPEGAKTGKYQVTITGSKGVVVGDHANVHMTFGADD